MVSLKEAYKWTIPGQVQHQVKGYRKGRKEDKEKEKTVKGLTKASAKQQKDVISGKANQTTDIRELNKQFEQAAQGSDRYYDDMKNKAMRDFNQQTVPNLINQYGQGSKSSSALNQALGAAAGNLHENIMADFAAMRQQQAQGIFGQSQVNRANNVANQSAASMGALGGYKAYMGPSNQSNFWGKAAPVIGLGVGAATGNPALGTQIGTAAGQVLT